MNKQTEALKMAIEAMSIPEHMMKPFQDEFKHAIKTCKEALEQRDLYSEIKEGFEALEQPAQSEYVVNSGGTGTELRKPAQDTIKLDETDTKQGDITSMVDKMY